VIRRSIKEWGRIAHGDDEDQIPVWASDRLVATVRAATFGGVASSSVLEQGRDHLRAGQHVGVIAAKDCSLEILPKIGDLQEGGIRQRLVHMLATVLDLSISAGAVSALDWQNQDLLEILIGLFSRKLTDVVRRGLPRQYVSRQSDLSALRGRLDITRQFTTLAVAPQRLACIYDELSPDIALNRIMKAAVLCLLRHARSADNIRRLRELLLAYVDVATAPFTTLNFGDLYLDRSQSAWRELLDLAKLLLANRFQGVTAGDAHGVSLLFEMNTLFEAYVAIKLRRSLSAAGFQVKAQAGGKFCLQDEMDSRQIFQTYPDIIVSRGKEIVTIIDTKWKRISSVIDDRKQGVSQADVYQMMAYGHIYDCRDLILLYPHHDGLKQSAGRTASHRIAGSLGTLSTMTVDLTAKDGIADLAALLLGRWAERADTA
jgi:5-methylcytosine-specific restriction enzyme subunit McrC